VWEKVLPLLLAFIAGALGSIVAPWVNWGIERRREDLKYKRECINAWRQLVADLAEHYKVLPNIVPKTREHPLEFLNSSTAFYSLRPLLTPTAVEKLNSSFADAIRSVLIDEIGRIEKEWGLL
jgi:hypothetical protein